MEGLRDIQGIVTISDYSLYYLIGMVVLFLLTAALSAWWLYKRSKMPKSINIPAIALQKLQGIDFNDAKQSVYDFTRYAHYAIKETKQKELEMLLAQLEPYKFKKEVPKLDQQIIVKMKQFIKEARHG